MFPRLVDAAVARRGRLARSLLRAGRDAGSLDIAGRACAAPM
jgi:hypothetical protein